MKIDYRTIEAAAAAIANEKGLKEGDLHPDRPDAARELESEQCMRGMTGSIRAKVEEILNSNQRSSFIAAVQKMLSSRYGA